MNSEIIDGHLRVWGRLWGVPTLSERVKVSLGKRLRRGLGRCRPSTGAISLNPVLFEEGNEAIMVEIVCHEAAHMAAHILHGKRIKPHGSEWKRLIQMAGYAPRARLPAGEVKGLALGRPPSRYEYFHTCEDCRTVFRSSRTDHRWRCRKCYSGGKGGKLEVVRKSLKR